MSTEILDRSIREPISLTLGHKPLRNLFKKHILLTLTNQAIVNIIYLNFFSVWYAVTGAVTTYQLIKLCLYVVTEKSTAYLSTVINIFIAFSCIITVATIILLICVVVLKRYSSSFWEKMKNQQANQESKSGVDVISKAVISNYGVDQNNKTNKSTEKKIHSQDSLTKMDAQEFSWRLTQNITFVIAAAMTLASQVFTVVMFDFQSAIYLNTFANWVFIVCSQDTVPFKINIYSIIVLSIGAELFEMLYGFKNISWSRSNPAMADYILPIITKILTILMVGFFSWHIR